MKWFRWILLLVGGGVLSFSLSGLQHTVQRGESLSSIAARYDVPVAEIARVNGIRNHNHVEAGKVLTIPGVEEPEPSREIVYVVRRGDTLSGIAARYGLPTKQLQQYNDIQRANRIRAGQRLRIPVSTEDHPSLPVALRSSLEGIEPSSRWRTIIIHHTATTRGDPAGLDRFHREERRMRNGLAYHFLIGNGNGMDDGEIYIGDRWRQQLDGGHVAIEALNHRGIGIALVGNFENRRPSSAQMESLIALVRYLQGQTGIPSHAVTTHKGVHPGHTVCPGRLFPERQLQQAIRN